ncbi:MAG: HAD family hydrolase [Clostridia bacterium]|nr:HAD family hydrolase [Clostridia bacterium]
MVDAVFIDFYGTVVYEDEAVVERVSREICEKGDAESAGEVIKYWWKDLNEETGRAFGESFKTQRELEYGALVNTIRHFHSSADENVLAEALFEQWAKPPIFPEAKEFFEKRRAPIYIVSNVDRADIEKAVAFHALCPDGIYTSEDARSYKPRGELFDLALNSEGLDGKGVVHIGDSLTNDVACAKNAGLGAIWINRSGRNAPEGVVEVKNLLEAYETEYFKAG